ncbi:MAG: purine-nucleoside phosphorylase [Calditrichaeota bacterium]|nr:MAG: purine-nucleoside phosphorylase [Calditrichota bacterium]MBL1205051.1 purine-nucleoside phosphorylase [Calditrichota bacterium]NOG44881.1 purine-nucleoside phosphorylase [Calditrichota bacterium]
MSIHIAAKPGEIAETVLLPGDPLRAKFVADTFLDNAVCYNEVRGMLGFTGTYKGRRVSVQGTGMGIPSISIYVNELIADYGPKNLVRVGSCGSIQKNMNLKDVILASAACTDSQVNHMRFKGMDFAPIASFSLLQKAHEAAVKKNYNVEVGNVLSADRFYHDDPNYWKLWAKYNVLAIEMETAELYTLGALNNINVLSILTVSDNILTGDVSTSEERQSTFSQMIELALEATA